MKMKIIGFIFSLYFTLCFELDRNLYKWLVYPSNNTVDIGKLPPWLSGIARPWYYCENKKAEVPGSIPGGGFFFFVCSFMLVKPGFDAYVLFFPAS